MTLLVATDSLDQLETRRWTYVFLFLALQSAEICVPDVCAAKVLRYSKALEDWPFQVKRGPRLIPRTGVSVPGLAIDR